MIKNILLLVFLCNFQTITTKNSIVAIILMVKNEESAMQPTLQPFIDAGIHDYLILDTGSTDKTIQVTQELFTKHAIKNGYIIEQPFIDFATSRNYALKCAEEKFPHATFFLMIDADWIMHNVHGLLQFCIDHINDSAKTYVIRMNCPNNTSFQIHRLLRAHNNLFFTGAVHETLTVEPKERVPETVYFDLNITHYGFEKSRQRWLRDCELLKKELEDNPKSEHALFYLGQTYEVLDDYDNAIKYLELFQSSQGPTEFNFMTCCKIAELYQKKSDWPKALYYYLEAHNIAPKRAEPLVALADYYMCNYKLNTAYSFAKKALPLPPPNDSLFMVGDSMYKYKRYLIFAKLALCLGKYETGKKALDTVLATYPDDAEALRVQKLYIEKMNEGSHAL